MADCENTPEIPDKLEEPLPKQIELMYENALKNIDFIKKQEWVFTTSALTAYGALYLAAEKIKFTCDLKPWIIGGIVASVFFSGLIFCGMCRSLKNSRRDLKYLFKTKWLKPLNFGAQGRSCFDRWGIFFWLLLIVTSGAVVTAYGIWKISPTCAY